MVRWPRARVLHIFPHCHFSPADRDERDNND